MIMHQLDWPLRFGSFIPPIHMPDQSPTAAFHRDVELIVRMDELGFDEAWVGEHHSSGHELIASPEVFLAYAAAKTQRIMLGTGVASIPYHSPFMTATRAVLLDHLTRGRIMLGVGPGALPTDVAMFGLDPMSTRPRLEEGLDVILSLFRGETVTVKSDWFTLNEAQLQVLPYNREMEIAVTAQHSASGPRLAGRLGAGMLSLNATTEAGLKGLSSHWDIVEEQAAYHGSVADRRKWRVVAPMHIAETREQAMAEVKYGLPSWLNYMTKIGILDLIPDDAHPDDFGRYLTESGFAVIGTPDDAIKLIEELIELSGGFGAFLLFHHDWATRDATHKSYELIARHVMPRFTGQLDSLQRAKQIAIDARDEGVAKARAARAEATRRYEQERAARADIADENAQ
jgi:limonene 1,2-monooxygenase